MTLHWSAARVLVTGAGGVLGTALLTTLRALSPAALFAPTRADCDLIDQHATWRAIADFRPTLVFHLAGRVAGLGGNLAFTGQAYFENAQINLNVVEGARRAGAAKIVAAGTTAVYSDKAPMPMREDDIEIGPPHGSEAPYAHAKRGMLAMLEAYRTQYGLPFAYMVCTNLYGPNDRFDEVHGHVVPSLISRFHRTQQAGEKQIVCWGDGTPTRDFLYAADAAAAFVTAAESGQGAYNTATGQAQPIRDLVEAIRAASGFDGDIVWDTTKPNGQQRRSYDVSRLRALGWHPATPLSEGIARTWRFYADNAAIVRR